MQAQGVIMITAMLWLAGRSVYCCCACCAGTWSIAISCQGS